MWNIFSGTSSFQTTSSRPSRLSLPERWLGARITGSTALNHGLSRAGQRDCLGRLLSGGEFVQLGEEGFASGRRNLSPLSLRRFEPELFGDRRLLQDLLFGLTEGGAARKLRNDRNVALVLGAVEDLYRALIRLHHPRSGRIPEGSEGPWARRQRSVSLRECCGRRRMRKFCPSARPTFTASSPTGPASGSTRAPPTSGRSSPGSERSWPRYKPEAERSAWSRKPAGPSGVASRAEEGRRVSAEDSVRQIAERRRSGFFIKFKEYLHRKSAQTPAVCRRAIS